MAKKIPAYAQHAKPTNLVRVLCKGKCCTTTWHEMTVLRPSESALRNSKLGDYEATCLKCGRIAKDSYNWLVP